MRVLLVNPPIERRRVYGRFSFVAPNLPPLGICYIASVLLEEMATIKRDYGVQFVSFEDDNFLVSKQRAAGISEQLIASELDLEWGCSVRAEAAERDLLQLMRRAGCRVIYMGIESASSRLLRLMKRSVSIDEVKRAAELVMD